MRTLIVVLVIGVIAAGLSSARGLDPASVDAFIGEMVARHGFDRTRLDRLFRAVKPSSTVLAAISKPAETKPWYHYRALFLTRDRIDGGVELWSRHRRTLAEVERRYRVPPEIVAGIIGVETFYGRRTGDYSVLQALSTLAFEYPPRAAFFRSELEQMLLLTREHGMDPRTLRGSYAGAMGIPQFMPSSFRRYAADFEGDGRINIWGNPRDAIASVASYLAAHGWQSGAAIAVRARGIGTRYREFLYQGSQPRSGLDELLRAGIVTERRIPGDPPALLVALQGTGGRDEYWVVLNNFYVITRYNRSASYAMAVYQLGEAIRNAYKANVFSRVASGH